MLAKIIVRIILNMVRDSMYPLHKCFIVLSSEFSGFGPAGVLEIRRRAISYLTSSCSTHREFWMIYRRQGFLIVELLGSSPTPSYP